MDPEKIQAWLEREARAVSEAPFFFVAALMAAGFVIWLLLRWRYLGIVEQLREQIKTLEGRNAALNEAVKERDARLDRQKIQYETAVEDFKRDTEALKAQIAKGETDKLKIEAARQEAWSSELREFFRRVQSGPIEISVVPSTPKEARASANASFLSSTGFVRAEPDKSGKRVTLTATDVIGPRPYFFHSEEPEDDESKEKP